LDSKIHNYLRKESMTLKVMLKNPVLANLLPRKEKILDQLEDKVLLLLFNNSFVQLKLSKQCISAKTRLTYFGENKLIDC
jgi:hypothetical protein